MFHGILKAMVLDGTYTAVLTLNSTDEFNRYCDGDAAYSSCIRSVDEFLGLSALECPSLSVYSDETIQLYKIAVADYKNGRFVRSRYFCR